MISGEVIVMLVLLGAFVGVAAGLFGIGGGGIFVPALSALFLNLGFPTEEIMHMALGTSMATIIATSTASAWAHHKRGGVIWPSWRAMTPGVFVGTFLATFLVAQLNAHALAVFFALFMSLVAWQMWFPLRVQSSSEPGRLELATAGGVIGAISALVSIGGGSLTVPYLHWRNHKLTDAIGTSAALGLPIAITGSLGYLVNGWQHTQLASGQLGFIYLPAVVVLTVASVLTAPLGVRLAHWLPVPILKKLFGLLIVVISVRMIWQVWQA